MIGADNQPVIKATHLSKGTAGHYLLDGFHHTLERVYKRHRDIELDMIWVSGHEEIEGNERADSEAKRAAKGNSSPDAQLPKHCRGRFPRSKAAALQHFHKLLKFESALLLSRSPRFTKLHEIDTSSPSPRYQKITACPPRRHASVLIQLRTGPSLTKAPNASGRPMKPMWRSNYPFS